MAIEQWLMDYGPWAGYCVLFLGSLVEGESVVLTAGFFAFKGYLTLPKIIAVSFTATLIADQVLFYVGRSYGPNLLVKYPKLKDKADRVFTLLHKYNTTFILGFRFIWGIRTVSPLVIGAAGIPIRRYTILNIIAAVIWSVLSCSAGYLLGYFFADSIDEMIQKVIRYQEFFVGGIVVLIIGVFIYKKYRRKEQTSEKGGT